MYYTCINTHKVTVPSTFQPHMVMFFLQLYWQSTHDTLFLLLRHLFCQHSEDLLVHIEFAYIITPFCVYHVTLSSSLGVLPSFYLFLGSPLLYLIFSCAFPLYHPYRLLLSLSLTHFHGKIRLVFFIFLLSTLHLCLHLSFWNMQNIYQRVFSYGFHASSTPRPYHS